MEPKTHMHNPSKLKRPLLFGIAVLAGLGAAYAFSRVDNTAPPFASVTDLPAGASVEAQLETKGSVTELVLQDSEIPFSGAPPSAPYRLRAAVKLPSDSYRDFIFTVTNDNKISVVADGFHAGDLLSLKINGRASYERVPADWSGKLELAADFPDEKAANACIYVIGKTESLGLCHVIGERRSL